MGSAAQSSNEETFLVLNTIVLKKSSTIEALATAVGIEPDAVARIVEALAAEEHVVELDGLVMPDDSAEEIVKEYNTQHWGDLRGQPDVERWHQRFEHVNELMLQAMDAWQQVKVASSTIPNDHSDVAYDDKIISRIDGIIAKVEELLGQLGKRVARFSRYADRFEAAMNQVERDRRYISDPRVESVHNIWFEMHEDILLLLGKQRVS